MFHICRTCLQEIRDSNFFTLTNNSSVSIIIKSQLALCVPEMIPDVVADPVMCHSCVTALHSAFDFRYRCLQTEERIRNFLQSHRLNSSTTSVNLQEIFTNISGVNTARIAEDVQLASLETLLDIKCETLSIHENELDLEKIDTLQDSFIENDAHEDNDAHKENDAHEENRAQQLPQQAIPCSSNSEEIYTLEKLCISEELQLHFNCMFVEQSRLANTTHAKNDVFQNLVNLRVGCPLHPINSTGSGSYNLEDWNRFEDIFQGVIYTTEAFSCMEDESEEENPICCNDTSSYSSKQAHLNKRTSRVFKENEGRKLRGRPPTLVDSATCKKTSKKANSSNTENSLKYKRKCKKRKLVKPVKIRKSKRIRKLFKCNECGYTTKFLINLELHSVSHIEIDDEAQADSDADQCNETYYERKNSKYNKGYKYVRYDYTKKQRFAMDKRNHIEKKKSVQHNYSKSKLKNTHNDTKSHQVLGINCMKEDNKSDQYKQSAGVSETEDKLLRCDNNEKNQAITNKFSKHKFPNVDHNTDNREDDKNEHLATEPMKINEIGESSYEKDEINKSTVKEVTLNKNKDKEKKRLRKENQFSKSHNLQVEESYSNDQYRNNDNIKNAESKNDTSKNQSSKTDCITKKLKDCQIENNTGNEQGKANRSSDGNPNEISADSKYKQPLNNACVINNSSKLSVVAEHEQNKNDCVNTLKCNDHIADSVDAEHIPNQIEQNKSNVIIQSSPEEVQSFTNDNAKNKLIDERSQLHNNDTNTCTRSNNANGNKIENIFIEAKKLLKSHHFNETAKDETFSNTEKPEENRLEESTVKNHTEDCIANAKSDKIEENYSKKEEDSFKSDLVDKVKLLQNENGNQSKENKSCQKSTPNDSASDKDSTKNCKNVFTNQCLSVSNGNIDEKQFSKQVNQLEKQNFENREENSSLLTACKTNKTYIDGCEEKEIGQSSCHSVKLSSISAKRKLESHNVNKKFFKSDCGREHVSNIGGPETTVSKCSGSGHSEFCGCKGHQVAVTFKKDLADKIKLLLSKKDSVDRKADADAELHLEVP